MKPAAVDHSATRCRERRLFTNAKIEWMAAIRYAATAASSKDRIEKTSEKALYLICVHPRKSAAKTFLCAFVMLRVELRESKRGVGHPEKRVRCVVSTVPSGARPPGKALKLNDQDLLPLKPKRERMRYG
jgi:hypothetical protein